MAADREHLGVTLLGAEGVNRGDAAAAVRRARRNAALVVAAAVCLVSLVAGVSLLLDGRLGFEALLVARAREGWPWASRLLVGLASLAALVTAVLRVERGTWREGLFGALAWLAVGAMLGAWAGAMPTRPPPPAWTYAGLCGGVGAGILLRLALGARARGLGGSLRDVLLVGVAGAAWVWTSAAL